MGLSITWKKPKESSKEEKSESKKKYKKSPKTLDQILKESFTKEVSKNPILRNEMAGKVIGKEFGISLQNDPLEQQKKEFELKMNEEAWKSINSDPELKDEFYLQRIHTLMGSKPQRHRQNSEEEISYEPEESSIARLGRELSEFRDLQEQLGGGDKKGSFMDTFKDPDVMKAIIGLVASMKNSEPQAPQYIPQPVRTFVIQTEQGLREMSEDEYRSLQSVPRRQISTSVKPVEPPTITTPAEVKKIQSKETETSALPVKVTESPQKVEPKVESPTVKDESLTSTDEDPIMKYLNLEPAEFAKQLIDLSQGNPDSPDTQQAKAILEMLVGADYDSICELLNPYKDNEKYKIYIDQIINRKDWIEAVLNELEKLSSTEEEDKIQEE
jgi:hypothetical protein